MNRQNTLSLIAQKAIQLDWEVAFGGKSKGNQHLSRVNEIAAYLQRREGGDEFITLATAWVHDVTLAFGIDDNPDEIFQRTYDFLQPFNELSQSEKEAIAHNAASHESGHTQTVEARIVHDADVLDKSGMLGVIRHIWKMTNMIENRVLEAKDIEVLKQHLLERKQLLSTKTAIALSEYLHKGMVVFFESPEVENLVKLISEEAMAGKISDHIAEHLIDLSDQEFTLYLREQLSTKYLRE